MLHHSLGGVNNDDLLSFAFFYDEKKIYSLHLANKTLDTLQNVVSTYLPLHYLVVSTASQPVGTNTIVSYGIAKSMKNSK